MWPNPRETANLVIITFGENFIIIKAAFLKNFSLLLLLKFISVVLDVPDAFCDLVPFLQFKTLE